MHAAAAIKTLTTCMTPSANLLGVTLPGGWIIDRQLPRAGSDGATDMSGSFFSVCYIAKKEGEKGKVTEAFLKVIDIAQAVTVQAGSTLIERLTKVTASHGFECDVLDRCGKAKLDRVVQLIDKGEIPPPPGSTVPFPYILFEIADGDIRKLVAKSDRIDDAWRFRVLHDAAVGLQQLHGLSIAHQDLKPSNVLVFDTAGQGAKIGDLGRASLRGAAAAHDHGVIAGAMMYAPPEQVYGITVDRWEDRRVGCDLYHLGTLATFLFSGITPTSYYIASLEENLRPAIWGGTSTSAYEMALPMLVATFTAFVDKVSESFPAWAKDELTQIVMHACHPDYSKRGDPRTRQQAGALLGIPTFVSRFDRLSKRSSTEARK